MKKLLFLIMLVGTTSVFGQQTKEDSIKKVISSGVYKLLEKEFVGKPIYGTRQPAETSDSTIIILKKLKSLEIDEYNTFVDLYNAMFGNMTLTKQEQIDVIAKLIQTAKEYLQLIDISIELRKDYLNRWFLFDW